MLNLDSRASLNLSIGSRKASRNFLCVVYMYICMSAWRTPQHKLLNLMPGITDLSIGEQNKLETLRGMQKINLVKCTKDCGRHCAVYRFQRFPFKHTYR